MTGGMRAGDTTSSADLIRADIESTRARMGETLEELGTRLNPERLKQQARDTIHEATIGRVKIMARDTADRAAEKGRRMTDVVRDNPIPAAMIVAGLGWLIFGGRRSPSPTYATGSASPRYDGASMSYSDSMNDGNGLTDRVRDVAGSVASTASDLTHRATGNVSDLAGNVASTVASTTRTGSEKVTSAFGDNPLALGAVALAAGIAAGFSIPSTRKEGELFGEARDHVVDLARDAVQEKKEQVQHVAERVVSEASTVATKAAREEGLAS